jgi:uncharacterized damage-inducible protein DinB
MSLVQEEVLTSVAQSLLAEFEIQAPITRRFLERLPQDKLTWKPHTRSLTAGQLALHLALVPGAIVRFVQSNPAQAPKSFEFPQPATRDEILQAHDEGVAAVRNGFSTFDEAAMREIWRMVAGEKELLAQPRSEFIRNIMLNHWYQHRGQFAVYLRLLDVPVPASWGPSADELPPFMQQAHSA